MARSKRIPILALRETCIQIMDQIENNDAKFNRKSYWSFGRKGSRGVALLFLRDIGLAVLHHNRDTAGRTIAVDLNNVTRIINVYAPYLYGQQAFFERLEEQMVGPTRVILMEDFNCALFSEDRSSLRRAPRRLGHGYRGAHALGTLVDELGLAECWRALQPGRAGMTWKGQGLESRIDHVYISATLVDDLQSA
ncbi:hypothetical protein V5799_006095 [Amblyomma americanum]|uniref:exodeoxyribonuclease III n=1 Tax=Amblyomma americanum TaxID=6943 RepID=A0AAQ4DXD4_AMBAM